jgi:serine/threonine-protein kinase
MAPEQARGEEIDRRADIWSLGVVLWEAVTGSRLFRGLNEAATLNMTLHDDVPPPSQRRADLPPELEWILMRALSRNPDQRYATAAEMRDELEGWLSSCEPAPTASLVDLMSRLFGREMREQEQHIHGLLQAHPDSPESGVTMIAPLLDGSFPPTSLRTSEGTTVTELMTELTRQRRTTTWLLSGLLILLGLGLAFGVYWTTVLRPHQALATLPAAATLQVHDVQQPAAPSEPGHAAAQPAAVALAQTPAAPPELAQPSLGRAAPAAKEAAPAARAPGRRPLAVIDADAVSPEPLRAAPAAMAQAPASSPGPAPAAENGLLNLDTTPWSIVSEGGRVIGQTPLVGASLSPGVHTLTLSNPEQGLKTTYQVTISAGRTTARRIGLD